MVHFAIPTLFSHPRRTRLALVWRRPARSNLRKAGRARQKVGRVSGVSFAVWAPHAEGVSVVGNFNGWNGQLHQMRMLGGSGVWELFIPDLEPGTHVQV